MKMFSNSSTRIFLKGNEDVARWHLPVVLSRFKAFVSRCKNSGLKQDRFTMTFEEDGTVVFGQYFYGEESVQIYSPVRTIVIEEKSKDDLSVETKPKTFWVNTTQGYFWVEVRYNAEGAPNVTLTQFAATTTAEVGSEVSFVYPGFAINAPGMYASVLVDSTDSRYVVAQDGAAMVGAGEDKGTIVSASRIAETSRMTILGGNTFLCVENGSGKLCRAAKVSIVQGEKYPAADVVEFEFSMLSSARNGILSAANLHNGPCWIHRKCSGSYFSPNKTIGYHVDIGSDDSYFGNLTEIPSGIEDKVDNAAGYDEAVFNHTPDLYRIAALLGFPVDVSENTAEFLMISPTMCYDALPMEEKCWGGYGWDAASSCADYRQDFDRWVLAPSPILVTVEITTGKANFSTIENSTVTASCMSWCGKFNAAVVVSQQYHCDSAYYEKLGKAEVSGKCSWSEDCSGKCSSDPEAETYTAQCPGEWTPYVQQMRYTQESIKNTKHIVFRFGNIDCNPMNLAKFNGFYFLFDGFWQLAVGLLWTTAEAVGDGCGICAYPAAGQTPGLNVIFKVFSPHGNVIVETGHEYVSAGLEIISPLGMHRDAGDVYVGFIAKVSEDLAAPTPPRMLTGGVEYPSPDVPDTIVRCEHSLMSRPCLCSGNMEWSEDNDEFTINAQVHLSVVGGCPPYTWQITGGSLIVGTEDVGSFYESEVQSIIAMTSECAATVTVVDACQQPLVLSDAFSIVGVVYGEQYLAQGETSTYIHNLGPAFEYTGDLPVVSLVSNGAILQMPEDATSAYNVSFIGPCNSSAEMTVTSLYDVDGNCLAPSHGCGTPTPGMLVSFHNLASNPTCYRMLETYSFSMSGFRSPDSCLPNWVAVSSGTGGNLVQLRPDPGYGYGFRKYNCEAVE